MLQALLDITVKRILESLPERVQNKDLKFIFKWGCFKPKPIQTENGGATRRFQYIYDVLGAFTSDCWR